jgi:lysophospholipase L1-like esterase
MLTTKRVVAVAMFLTACTLLGLAQGRSSSRAVVDWAASWVASVHGPYPSGNPSAQPDLKFAFPTPAAGADDQTFRLIVRPSIWSSTIRIRLANTFGTQPVTFDGVFAGLQASGAEIVAGTNHPVRFGGKPVVILQPGQSIFSDSIALNSKTMPPLPALDGRKLAVSFHVAGTSGPMTWHAKALQTSYVTKPKSGSQGGSESDTAFPFTTTSWFFLDAIDVMAPPGTAVVCAFGDSITDGTNSTLNGDDRWPDVLARRLQAVSPGRVSVVNAGIGGNRILTPDTYPPPQPFAGGPSALQRLERDVLGLSQLSTIVLLEGINDIGAGASAEAITTGMRELVGRVRAKGNIKIVGATITSALGANGNSGTPDANERRKAVNTFIRTSGLFDAVADFDAATLDAATSALKEEFQPNSTIGGAGDKLHPNRAGYQAMGNAIDLKLFTPVTER